MDNIIPSAVTPAGSDRDFRILVEGVKDYAIFMLSTEGCIKSWNEGACLITGYTFDEVRDRDFCLFYPTEEIESGRPHAALAEALKAGCYRENGWRVRKDGSTFMATVVVNVLRDEYGQVLGFAKVVRDVTEQVTMQEALDAVREETREQLFQAQKLEAVGKLTGGIAHDFNNLLTIIRGSIELAERHAAGNAKLKALLEAVQGAAGRAADLTHQLLSFSRRQPLRPAVIDLLAQLTTVSTFLDRSLGGHIEVRTDLPGDLWRVEIDPRQFELALLNIGLNARDAMPKGGVLRIIARNISIDDSQLGIKGDYVRLTIADTGVGIPPELLSKVIEPFFTTKDVGKGSGLGLSQAYGFAQQSGGALSIDSQVGRGTQVHLCLPARAGTPTPAIEAAEEVRSAPTGSGRVLVVEDEDQVRDLAVELLEFHGYTVMPVCCAAEALAAFETNGPFDLMFSDIIMPGRMDGIDLALKISETHPEMPILLTTGYSETAVTLDAQRFPLLSKPYRLVDLAARVAHLLQPTTSPKPS
jgi:PAS domain S-box-containing protein